MAVTQTLHYALLALAFSAGLRAAPPIGLAPGEYLRYSVAWAIIPGAGEIEIGAQAAAGPQGAPLLRVHSHTSTRGLARLLLPFDADAESLFDLRTGRLTWLGESSSARSKKSAHTVAFKYDSREADYVTTVPTASSRVLPLPPGYPTDLITCLVQSRTWDLKPGQARDALVLFEDDFYLLTIHALNYERISTPVGDVNALVLEPRMEKTPPKGMFRHGSTVQVWISQGPRRLPVRFRVEFGIGAGVATLEEYRGPGTTLGLRPESADGPGGPGGSAPPSK